MGVEDVVDIAGTRAAVARHRAELRDRGVSVVPGFVDPAAVAEMVAVCDALGAEAYHQDVRGTPYLERPDDSWPADHPRRSWSRSSVHTLGYDQLPTTSLVRRLFESDELTDRYHLDVVPSPSGVTHHLFWRK